MVIKIMECVFCKIANGSIPAMKVYEDELIMAFMDANPVSAGHVLIIPKEHTLDFETISLEVLMEIVKKAKDLARMIVSKLDAQGYALVQNNGICQEVKHFHLHIIPKYEKKNNLTKEEAFKKITA